MSACAHCGRPLGAGRSDRRYCSPSCRTMASRQRRRQAADEAAAAPFAVAAAVVAHQAASPPASTMEQRLAETLKQLLDENVLVAEVVKAARRPGGWRAAAYLLEHLYPERWGERTRRGAPALDGAGDPFAEFVGVDELAPRRARRPVRGD